MPNIHNTISFGLVSIPIVLNPLIKNNDTAFNQLHKKCLNRVQYVKFCPYCNEKLKESDIIKGYEFEKDDYLTFTKDELNKLKPENNKEIEIISFIDLEEIDPKYFEKSYILVTEKKSKAYSLFLEALKKTNKVALGKTVIGSKFYYCILRFSNNEIIMTTLYFEEEILKKENAATSQVTKKELDMALLLIDKMTAKFEPQKYEDEYQNSIKKAIDDKLNGKTIKAKKKKNKKQISNLMEALEKSLKAK